MSNFLDVTELNNCIGNPKGDMDNLDWDALGSQLALIKEEFEELIDAVTQHNITEVRDATADILVTTYGMAHRAGFDADQDMQVVHQSNMSKFCITRDEAAETAMAYEKLGLNVTFRYLKNGSTAVISAKDQSVNGKFYPKGKLLKSINFKEPIFT